ncbi:polyphosphate kinase 1 [Chamaesiphon polymorphus]|uniref:Polyphosphate kinase n=1 Tax=Chamaesiphon polymorphus CCALA 037 TaxID=2107692 RepID=A0A2T1GB58_9CYAN|nr:polyphosphate kinase 1 [Chamaesiphon polymorphus]PSB54431.1 polyphosphate kinase 1 [Chamaesiphon polymorphus CCALA 037]
MNFSQLPTTNPSEIDLSDPQYYLSRELTWLEFNARVLHEAMDDRTPLLERLKFMSIFSSNLDEFFMVRIAAISQQIEAKVSRLTPDGRTPNEQLAATSQRVQQLITQQHQHFETVLRPAAIERGIYLLDYFDLNQEQCSYLQTYFEEQIFPVLTPLAVDPGHPFPYISNLSLNLAVVIKHPDTGEELFARVKVPKVLPRFISLPKELQVVDIVRPTENSLKQNKKDKKEKKDRRQIWTGIPLEQLIAHNLESLFPGMNIQGCFTFRVTRNADISVAEDEADDLLQAIEDGLQQRRKGGSTVRIEVDSAMPEQIRRMLQEELEVNLQDIYEVDGMLGLGDLMYFLSLPAPELKDPPWNAIVPAQLRRLKATEDSGNFFNLIAQKDFLVHHPYQSFTDTVERFINCAANDSKVLAIKMTLYRTTGDSHILKALIKAAENGKQVSVLIELKARFDEQNNINLARMLEQAGIHVVYGLVGLKTHTKVVLVVRREDEKIRRYVHIGTGNYNAKTSKLYTDVGLFSCRPELGADLTDLFNYLTGYSQQRSYRKLLVSPVNTRELFDRLIQQEIEHVQSGKTGRIVAKMNALIDTKMIASLYRASQAGVSIDLIIRGMCCLRPGVPGVSENIRVISIIGRFLEHSRIYYFNNGGEANVFIGSADWMTRNLDRRVEVITPIEDPDIAKDLQEILGIMLADNRQAWDMQSDGSYIQRRPEAGAAEESTQRILMEMAAG